MQTINVKDLIILLAQWCCFPTQSFPRRDLPKYYQILYLFDVLSMGLFKMKKKKKDINFSDPLLTLLTWGRLGEEEDVGDNL